MKLGSKFFDMKRGGVLKKRHEEKGEKMKTTPFNSRNRSVM